MLDMDPYSRCQNGLYVRYLIYRRVSFILILNLFQYSAAKKEPPSSESSYGGQKSAAGSRSSSPSTQRELKQFAQRFNDWSLKSDDGEWQEIDDDENAAGYSSDNSAKEYNSDHSTKPPAAPVRHLNHISIMGK